MKEKRGRISKLNSISKLKNVHWYLVLKCDETNIYRIEEISGVYLEGIGVSKKIVLAKLRGLVSLAS